MSEDIKLSENAQKVLELIESMTILEAADLVTEMREVRHYYASEGLEARKGIEY